VDTTSSGLTIGTIAKMVGVNVETIRFYQRSGLLSPPAKPSGSIRRYSEAHVSRVRFIKAAQQLGFSLDEISGLLRLEDGTSCDEARELAQEKLRQVRSRLDALRRIESVLAQLVHDCAVRKGSVKCPLISALQHSQSQSTRDTRTCGGQ
jgi:MerR family transcriptional regulator, mercuric resistance operon regulatory protein